MELPLKAIVRGYSWTVVPGITWRNRAASAVAKLKIKEMGSRYFFSLRLMSGWKNSSAGAITKNASKRIGDSSCIMTNG